MTNSNKQYLTVPVESAKNREEALKTFEKYLEVRGYETVGEVTITEGNYGYKVSSSVKDGYETK